VWPESSADPEPADFKVLEGDLAPLLFALESSLDADEGGLVALGVWTALDMAAAILNSMM